MGPLIGPHRALAQPDQHPAMPQRHSYVTTCFPHALPQNRKIIEHFTGRDDRLLYRSATYAEDPLGTAAGPSVEGADPDMPGEE